MKRVLQDTGAATSSQKKTKDTASGSSPALQDTCWKHFKGVDREASDSCWYLATRNFCAHAERLGLKTGRARAHLDCISGQNVTICSTVPSEIRDQLRLPAYYRRHSAAHRQLSAYIAGCLRITRLDRA